MFRPAHLGVLVCLFVCFWSGEASARIGQSYGFESFQPFLDRGYNTRLGWQGRPVDTQQPRLYLHSAQKLSLLAELEFSQRGGLIHTEVLKLYLAPDQSNTHPEAIWFLSHASHARLGLRQIEALLHKKCYGEWRVAGASPLFVSLLRDKESLYLRLSQQGQANAPPVDRCLSR
ncbi:MAG: hypothetical protein IGS03_15745 [Candidatus Sericytochromatia bacterium]|nr:hypothetical protein [Candidatus Sericytochromatia bacterium]